MDFKLPIEYTSKKMILEQHIINDLELVKLSESETELVDDKSIYGILMKPSHILCEKSLLNIVKEYSYDKNFLKDTQKVVIKYNTRDLELPPIDVNEIYREWVTLKQMKNFKDHYQYFNWDVIEFLNNSDQSLQFMTVYTLTSPILSLLYPIFAIIIPFLIIKLKGLPLSFSQYYLIICQIRPCFKIILASVNRWST